MCLKVMDRWNCCTGLFLRWEFSGAFSEFWECSGAFSGRKGRSWIDHIDDTSRSVFILTRITIYWDVQSSSQVWNRTLASHSQYSEFSFNLRDPLYFHHFGSILRVLCIFIILGAFSESISKIHCIFITLGAFSEFLCIFIILGAFSESISKIHCIFITLGEFSYYIQYISVYLREFSESEISVPYAAPEAAGSHSGMRDTQSRRWREIHVKPVPMNLKGAMRKQAALDNNPSASLATLWICSTLSAMCSRW